MNSASTGSFAAMAPDPYNLARFVDAQLDIYADALQELRSGAKRSHWMWFIFPQFAGLGTSEMSIRYAIGNIEEATAFLRHPLLGARLEKCTTAVIAHRSLTLDNIFGTVDALKFRSSMTLFEVAAPDNKTIRAALESKCNAKRDPMTLELLG